jgi:predicted permease
MTVPLWAALLSLIVACVQPVQHALEEHMQPVKGALNSAGNCSIPLTLVILGAYFYVPKEDPTEGKTPTSAGSSGSLFHRLRNMLNLKARWRHHRRIRSSGSISTLQKPEGRPGETKTVIIAILSRMIIVPLLLIPLMALSAWYDWHAVFAE